MPPKKLRRMRLRAPTIITEVTDDEVMGQSYIMLKKIHRNGFFGDPTCGDRREGVFVKKTPSVEYWCPTCRRRKPSSGCPICNMERESFPLSEYGRVGWRKIFKVIANAYPYLPNHLLLTTAKHETQDFIFRPNTFNTLCDFYDAFMFSGSMFFNHYAGNSLEHFHVHHTTRTDFPIIKFLHDLRPTHLENVFIVDSGDCFRAIVLKGDDAWRWGEDIIQNIHQKSLPLNIVWANPVDHGPLCIIFVRSTTATPYGSTELAGFIIDCDALTDLSETCITTILSSDQMIQLIPH